MNASVLSMNTLRSHVNAALIVLLVSIGSLAVLVIWGTDKAISYFERSQFTYNELEANMQFLLKANHLFKQLAGAAAKEKGKSDEQIYQAYRDLYPALEKIEALAEMEVEAEQDSQHLQEELEELERLKKIRTALDNFGPSIEAITALQDTGRLHEAYQLLLKVSEDITAGEFGRLLDVAIQHEQSELERLHVLGSQLAQTQYFAAITIAGVSLLFALVFGYFTLRRIERPLRALIVGTNKIATGDLNYRIDPVPPRELAELAVSFNQMADDICKQHNDLLQARTGLEQKVADRTEELARANQELRRLDGTRQRFIADISHELRTPLTIIKGESEVTLRSQSENIDDYKNALSRIVDLTDQLGLLVEDLLLVARSDTATLQIDRRKLSLHKLLRDLEQQTATMAARKDMRVSLNLAGGDMLIRGDDRRLKQLFLIIIDNALRYSERAGEVVISTSAENGCAIVKVHDMGIGIDKTDIEKVFDRFYRSDSARALVPSGTGLGLPLAKSIVQAHQGGISIDSTQSAGTTVTVTLPLQ